MTRLELLEKVNELNVQAVREGSVYSYYVVTVMYNTVIYKRFASHPPKMHEVIEGVPK